jgi:cobalt-zinc-cadmium efflux system outer membrane protein
MSTRIRTGWHRLAWLALLSAGAAAAAPLQADAPPPEPQPLPPITLAQAFEAAWARQPETLAGPSQREAAQQLGQAARRWSPEPPALSLNLRSDRYLGRQAGQREQELGIAVPLWLPGERQRSQALAAAELAAVDSRSTAAAWRLAGSLREAWWAQQRARQNEALAQARERSAAALARDVQRRVAAGELARSDAHQAEGLLAAARAEAALAQAEATQATLALQALGVTAPPAELPEPLPADLPPGTEPDPAHPALRELEDRRQLAERSRALAATQGRANPELTLSATRERGAFGEDYGRSLTLGFKLPLGNEAGQRAKLATAGAAALEAEAQLMLERQRLAADQAGARARLAATELALQAAEQRARLAAEARGFIEKSFRLGESDLPTRLRVELEAFEAQRQQALARLARHQAVSTLRQALGLLPQ